MNTQVFRRYLENTHIPKSQSVTYSTRRISIAPDALPPNFGLAFPLWDAKIESLANAFDPDRRNANEDVTLKPVHTPVRGTLFDIVGVLEGYSKEINPAIYQVCSIRELVPMTDSPDVSVVRLVLTSV